MATLFIESVDSKWNIIVEEIITTIKAEDFKFEKNTIFQANEWIPQRVFLNIDYDINKKKIISLNKKNEALRKRAIENTVIQLEKNINNCTKKMFKDLKKISSLKQEINLLK